MILISLIMKLVVVLLLIFRLEGYILVKFKFVENEEERFGYVNNEIGLFLEK